MVNPKYVIVFSCVGLVLSFIICLISRISVGTMVVRALVFAAVFAVLGAAVQIVYNKFLVAGDGSFSDAPAGAKVAPGSVVNVSVDDDALPDDEVAPRFEVKNTAPIVAASASAPDDGGSSSAETQNPSGAVSGLSAQTSGGAGNSGFKPVDLSFVTAKPDSLDELPDIGDVSVSRSSDDSGIISSITGDDDDSDPPLDAAGTSGGRGSSSVGNDQDAATYAKAISTLLANDN